MSAPKGIVCLYKAERTKTETKQMTPHSLPLGELISNPRKKQSEKRAFGSWPVRPGGQAH
jgi:hypothetical protein